MGRWNENVAWREFRLWLAAAGLGVYVGFSLYTIFFLAEVQTSDVNITVQVVCWMFRVIVSLNLVAIIWGCLKIIDIKEGEWPN